MLQTREGRYQHDVKALRWGTKQVLEINHYAGTDFPSLHWCAHFRKNRGSWGQTEVERKDLIPWRDCLVFQNHQTTPDLKIKLISKVIKLSELCVQSPGFLRATLDPQFSEQAEEIESAEEPADT